MTAFIVALLIIIAGIIVTELGIIILEGRRAPLIEDDPPGDDE